MFTNINNIFCVCVDNLKKLSYNVKRALLRTRVFIAEMPKILLFILFFIMAIILSSFEADCSERVGEDAQSVKLKIEAVAFIGETLSVAIRYDGVEALCGVLATLEYDTEVLSLSEFVEGKDLDDGGCLTCAFGEGSVSFLLDSSDALGNGELALIRFSCRGEFRGTVKLLLRGGYGNACVLRDGTVAKAYLFDSALMCETYGCVEGGFFVSDISVRDSDLVVWGSASQSCCFIGFDVTVTDIYGNGAEAYTVSAKTEMADSGAFCAKASLPKVFRDGSIIVIKPLCYVRDGVEIGKEKIFLVFGGELRFVGGDR